MKNAMQKDFWREIGHTRSRFFSIMILVALSVAFLSGLKATAPDMKHTGDDYLDSLHLADIQVLSTLGLTDEDIAALRAQDKIEDAEGEYVIDAFASSDSLDAVVKVLSLTDRGISDVLLREGRMPERADECVVEENMLSLMSIPSVIRSRSRRGTTFPMRLRRTPTRWSARCARRCTLRWSAARRRSAAAR